MNKEERLKEIQRILEKKDSTISKLQEENERLKSIISGKTFFDEKAVMEAENERLNKENKELGLKCARYFHYRGKPGVIGELEAEIERLKGENNNWLMLSEEYSSLEMKMASEVESLKGKLKEAGNPSPQRTRQAAENDSLV